MRIALALALMCCIAVAALAAYVPAARPADWFIGAIRDEHALTARLLGTDHATRILARALEAAGDADDASPAAVGAEALAAAGTAAPTILGEIAAVQARVMSSTYVLGARTFLLLAAYRMAELIEVWPVIVLLLAAGIVDGLVRRTIKATEFGTHSPEVYAIHLCLSVLIVAAIGVAVVAPWVVHPVVLLTLSIALSVPANFAIANYHTRPA